MFITHLPVLLLINRLQLIKAINNNNDNNHGNEGYLYIIYIFVEVRDPMGLSQNVKIEIQGR